MHCGQSVTAVSLLEWHADFENEQTDIFYRVGGDRDRRNATSRACDLAVWLELKNGCGIADGHFLGELQGNHPGEKFGIGCPEQCEVAR